MKNIKKKLLSIVLALTMIAPMFVLPSVAEDTTPELVTSPDGYSNIEVRVTTDKDPLNYRIGDQVTFTMKVYADNKHISVPMIKASLEGDGSTALGVDKYLEYINLTPDENGVFTLTRDVISIPGYMRLEGNIYSADGSTMWPETPNNDRARALGAGILVNYEEITTVSPEPDDFDQVWADRLADLEAVPPRIARIDKVTSYYSGTTLKTLTSSSNYDVYALYLDCPGSANDVILSDEIGNEVGATWAVAYLTVPKNKTAESMSISQGYQGYGINTATPTDTTSSIAINMATHSLILLCNENAATSTEYRSKYASYIKLGTKYGTDATDNAAIETCYFANLLLRDLQLLRFTKQAFGSEGAASLIDSNTEINGMTEDELLTAMEYWSGLHNGQISVSGGSQGGFQALGVGALDHDVTTVGASIPWMGDTHIDTDTNRVLGGSSRPSPGEGIRYCDTAFLAARVEAPVTITARLVDKSCVPSGVISIWNNLVESKKDVEDYKASIVWIQSGTHGYTPTYAGNQTQTLRTYELLEPTGIANNLGGFISSGFTDIDGYTDDQDAAPPSTGYIQIATSDKSAATVPASGATPDFYYQGGANVYYNAELKKLVFVSQANSVSSGWGLHNVNTTQNSSNEGSVWHLAYWAAQNNIDIEHLELRRGSAGYSFSGFGYFISNLTATKTVKYDYRFTSCSWGGSATTGVVVGMTSLESLGHGSFASDGTFTSSSYEEGEVNLTGFSGLSTSHWGYFLSNCVSTTEVVTHTLEGANMFPGCSWLSKVTIPATANLTSIGANGFADCNNFESIDIECSLTSLTIGSAAFSGRAITINVKTESDKTIVTNALSAAGITNVTVLSAGEEAPDDPQETSSIPLGIPYGQSGFTTSVYTDLNSTGWTQVGGPAASATVTQSGDTIVIPSLYCCSGGTAYFNEEEGRFVIVSNSSLAANFGDHSVVTQASLDAQKENVRNLLIANHDKIIANPVGANYSATGCTTTWISTTNVQAYADAYEAAIADGQTEDDAKTAGADATIALQFKWSKIKNSADVGCVWNIAYWINQNQSKITAFEIRSTSGAVIHSCTYYFSLMKKVETAKISSNVKKVSYTTSGVGAFNEMSSLVSLGHGNFATDGTFTATTYIEGIIDLTGFSTSEAGKLAYALYKNTSAMIVSAPRLDANMFNGATALTNVTIPEGFTLSAVGANTFNGCSALEYLSIEGTVSSDIAIDSTAFTGTSTPTVVVQTADEKSYFESALTTAGISNVTVILANAYVKDVANAIVSEGFSVRMNSYTGLRALFSFDESVAAINEYEGFTLVSYGVVAASYARFTDTYNSDEDALFAAARAQTNSAVKYIPVYNADGTGANKYVDYETRTFCIALTNISPENALSDVYMAGYAIWVDENGNEAYSITTYTMPDGQKAVNLYEITFGLTKTGIINSQNTEDLCFWQILSPGAFSVAQSEIKSVSDTLVVDYTFDSDGNFTYLDQPLRAWNYWKTSAGAVAWNSTGNTVEATSTTNIVWSILECNDELIVVYRRDPNAAESASATIPMVRDSYYASSPFSPKYFSYSTLSETATVNGDTTTNGLYKNATIYTPVVSDTNAEKITTLVIDYGVNAFASRSLDNSTVTNLKTVVYPEGMKATSGLLQSNSIINTMIYASENKTSLTEETQADDFGPIVDMSGLSSISLSFSLSDAKLVENVILPSTIANWSGCQEAFKNANSLRRVWQVGSSVPESGTVDLTGAKTLSSFCKNSFTGIPANTTFIMPASFQGVSSYSYLLNEGTACAQVFGVDTAYTLVLGTNVTALTFQYETSKNAGLIAYYDVLNALGSSDARYNNLDKITVVCTIGEETMEKTIAEWKTYLASSES